MLKLKAREELTVKNIEEHAVLAGTAQFCTNSKEREAIREHKYDNPRPLNMRKAPAPSHYDCILSIYQNFESYDGDDEE